MSKARVSETVARPVRTGVQSLPAFLIASLFDESGEFNFNNLEYSVVVVVLTLIVSFIQTAIENRIGSGLLRTVPPKDVPL